MLTLILGLKVSVDFLGSAFTCSQWRSGKILAAIDIGVEDKGPGFDSRTQKVFPLCSDSNVGTTSTQRCELPVCVKKTGFTAKTTYIHM